MDPTISPEVQAARDELSAYTLTHGDPDFIHQHVVDAFAAQHAAAKSSAIGVAFALIGLPAPRARLFGVAGPGGAPASRATAPSVARLRPSPQHRRAHGDRRHAVASRRGARSCHRGLVHVGLGGVARRPRARCGPPGRTGCVAGRRPRGDGTRLRCGRSSRFRLAYWAAVRACASSSNGLMRSSKASALGLRIET